MNKFENGFMRGLSRLRLVSDYEPPEPGPRPAGEIIQILRASYWGDQGKWIEHSSEHVYGPWRILWPLEAILGMRSAELVGGSEVRGEQCLWYAGDVRLVEVAGREEVRLVDPPRRDDELREVLAQVSVGADGLIRRIAWSPKFGKRRQGGLLSRVARARDGASSGSVNEEQARLWTVTEFWDYGCEVEITAPAEPVGG
jgi:hypothetical protein